MRNIFEKSNSFWITASTIQSLKKSYSFFVSVICNFFLFLFLLKAFSMRWINAKIDKYCKTISTNRNNPNKLLTILLHLFVISTIKISINEIIYMFDNFWNQYHFINDIMSSFSNDKSVDIEFVKFINEILFCRCRFLECILYVIIKCRFVIV